MTAQAGLVEAALADGRLRLPSPAAPSFVDLVNALHRGAGVPVVSTPHGDTLAAHLFDRDHLVIVLVDGMGMAALDEPAFADLRGRVRMELDSVFPATTACAITTVATGLWPGRHGIPGWYGYLPERDLSVTVLTVHRTSHRSRAQAIRRGTGRALARAVPLRGGDRGHGDPHAMALRAQHLQPLPERALPCARVPFAAAGRAPDPPPFTAAAAPRSRAP